MTKLVFSIVAIAVSFVGFFTDRGIKRSISTNTTSGAEILRSGTNCNTGI